MVYRSAILRMPLRLTPLDYILARLNLLPTPLFDASLTTGIAKMLVTACELGLFDLLAIRAMNREQLAEDLRCHPQGLELLLQILKSAGYLRLKKGLYYNTRRAQRWLVTSSAWNIAPYIVHSPDISAIWDHALQMIQSNAPAIRMPYEEDACTPEQQRLLMRHYAGLASLATTLGREIVYRVKLPAKAQRLLDVGGSHAAYSVLFCRRYPALQATILDLPVGIKAGKHTATAIHLEERMNFISGDIIKDDFGSQLKEEFDVALYFHIAHLLQPELNQQVLAKVVQTLKPGGMIVFVDQVTDQTCGSWVASLAVQLMALTMAIVGGTCYPFATVRGWLEQLGMGKIHRYRMLTPGVTLITAVKKDLPY
jgi:SAM-dependent methyltransferase